MANPTTARDAPPDRQSPAAAQAAPSGKAHAGAVEPRTSASPRFYVCVAILLLAALGMQTVAGVLGRHFRKNPVPLLRHLYELDTNRLRPEYRLHHVQPPPIDKETLANLGTEEYLQWYLIDTRCEPKDPAYLTRLFITYYTGQPDMVPHRPKECLRAAGLTLVNDPPPIKVGVPSAEGRIVEIPVSVLGFEAAERGSLVGGRGAAQRLTVAYFFYANGKYVTTRTEVRLATQNLLDRYAYYSKIEISLSDEAQRVMASHEQTVEALGPLLRKLMPILWEDHFQDWKALKAGKPPVVPES